MTQGCSSIAALHRRPCGWLRALMEKRIPYTEILEETFYKKTYLQNQVMGKALLESMRLLNGKCIVSVMRQKDMDFFGVTTTDLDGIVSQMKQTKGVEVAIFLYETDYMEYKVSLRSENIVDVSKVAVLFWRRRTRPGSRSDHEGNFS